MNWKQVHEKFGFRQKQSSLKIPYAKINSKWTQHLNEKGETINILKENTCIRRVRFLKQNTVSVINNG